MLALFIYFFLRMKKSLYSFVLVGTLTLTSLAAAQDSMSGATFPRSEMGSGMKMMQGTGMVRMEKMGSGMRMDRMFGSGMKNYGQEMKRLMEQKNMMKKGSGMTQSGNVVTAEQLACVRTALVKRESAILAANTATASATNSGLTARTADLYKAWMITDGAERRTAVKTAWDNWKKLMKATQESDKNARDAAWRTFRTEAQTCKVPEALADGEGEMR